MYPPQCLETRKDAKIGSVIQPLLDLRSFSSFSAPTHSLAKAHHSMQDVPIGRAFRCPHFLHWVSGSSVHISTFSPHFWQRISSGLGVRISALPGQPSLNMRPVYSLWKNNSMIHIIFGGILFFDGFLYSITYLYFEFIGDDGPV